MKTITVNKDVISALNPCKSRFDNYLKHYANFNGDVLEFIDLKKITSNDKLWVLFRTCPRFIIEVVAIDCAMQASEYSYYATAAAAYASYAADAADADAASCAAYGATTAADAADAAATTATTAAAADAAYTAAHENERLRQIEAFVLLINEYYQGEIE